ncbi:Tripartite tricarboxylate transporter TctB family protein [Lentibacillus persicus]|uniref:Tripartite tricarboxylate transporter TctB family protein n=2 Tax=Lentibacillus persicus TaxID=640948 RepID=A0A1I1W5G2_9BACI|nr:Tripartite tricarboxylate transporter TctB family protein [Lentibacillus persicus]
MRANYLLSIITIIVSVFFLVAAFLTSEAASSTNIGPMGWPIMILLFTLLMGTLLLLITWVKGRNTDQQDKGYIPSDDEAPENKHFHMKNRHFYILASIALYVLLLPVVGFIVVTPVLFFFLAWLLGMGKILKIVAVTVASNIVFVIIFIYLLGIPFPRGVGIFRSFSFLIY